MQQGQEATSSNLCHCFSLLWVEQFGKGLCHLSYHCFHNSPVKLDALQSCRLAVGTAALKAWSCITTAWNFLLWLEGESLFYPLEISGSGTSCMSTHFTFARRRFQIREKILEVRAVWNIAKGGGGFFIIGDLEAKGHQAPAGVALRRFLAPGCGLD